MQILNPEVTRRIERGDPLKLELGAGGASTRPGHFSIDSVLLPGVDVLADLNDPLAAFPDGSVSHVYTRHTLEHVSNLGGLLKEIHRICRTGATVEIVVPHHSNAYGFSDPTHVRFFGLYTMYYYSDPADQPKRKVPAYYTESRYKVKKIRIQFYRIDWMERLLVPFWERFVNLNFGLQDFYERRLSGIWPAWQIIYIMEPANLERAADHPIAAATRALPVDSQPAGVAAE
jgi:hypothetical protein